MSDNFLKTGKELTEALEQVDSTNEYATRIVDDLLYEDTITLISAEPGCGKSMIALQIAASLASTEKESRIFNQFFVGEAELVYYLQLEGSLRETLRRLKVIGKSIPFDPDLICIDYSTGYNVLRDNSADTLLARIANFKPSVLIIDPLYLLVSGGLSKDEPAAAVCRFLLSIVNRLHCAVIVLHHTTKSSYTSDGRRMEKEDEFYGSQWIKAHVDSSFQLSSANSQRTQVKLDCKKDRYGRLPKQIILDYDPDTFICTVHKEALDPDTFESKLLAFLQANRGKQFESAQLRESLGCSMATIRHLRRQPQFAVLVDFQEQDGRRTIWRVK